MIHHAWTVLCERSSVDVDTNNVTLSVVENLNVNIVLPPDQASEAQERKFALPVPLELVSLWYRDDLEPEESGEVEIELFGADKEKIGSLRMHLDFKTQRLRTRAKIAALPTNGAGIYFFRVSLEQGDRKMEVSGIPLELNISVEVSKKAEVSDL